MTAQKDNLYLKEIVSEKTDGGRRGGDVAYEGVVEEYALDDALSSFFELQERN